MLETWLMIRAHATGSSLEHLPSTAGCIENSGLLTHKHTTFSCISRTNLTARFHDGLRPAAHQSEPSSWFWRMGSEDGIRNKNMSTQIRIQVRTERRRKFILLRISDELWPVSVPTGRTESVVMSVVGMKLLGDGTISTALSPIPLFTASSFNFEL